MYFVNIMKSAFQIYIVKLRTKLFLCSKTVWIKCIMVTRDFNVFSFYMELLLFWFREKG